jgi:nicotinamidase-related amidase
MAERAIPVERCVLVVVDVQNDYCHDDGALGRPAKLFAGVTTNVLVEDNALDVAPAA